MAQTFDQIPSHIDINVEPPKKITVAEEIECSQQLLPLRITKCKKIPPAYKKAPRRQLQYSYKFFCVCPRYKPHYSCKHAGNIIIDRDVLTKEEHICYLSTPKPNYAAPRKQPRCYQKRAIVPNCTARIEALASPDLKRVKENLEKYRNTLSKRQFKALTKHLEEKPDVEYTNIETALNYIEEERRLKRVAKIMEKRRCKRMKKDILRKQRRQIKNIICVIFEAMKDFLLNDQFLIDEQSTLCAVILDQIRLFTDRDFYTTSNLREYQQVLANNLTVWINKFISNMNIHVAPPQPKEDPCPQPEPFLPVQDYISCSDSYENEEQLSEDICVMSADTDNIGEFEYEGNTQTDNTIINNYL